MTGPSIVLNGHTIPGRGYAALHFARLMPLFSKALQPLSKPDAARLLQWAGFQGYRLSPQRRRRLEKKVGGNPYSNSYHHPWHSFGVVMHAAVLAELAGFDRKKRDALLMAALCHDLDHRGKRASPVDYVEERRSARISIHTCFGTGSGRGRNAALLRAHLESTAAAWASSKPIDELTALLRDADIMASCFYPRPVALDLSRSVMREKGLTTPAGQALKGFLAVMKSRGFSHPITTKTAFRISASQAGAGHAPDVAASLGFKRGAKG